MNGPPTARELAELTMRRAEEGRTPRLRELSVTTCSDMLGGYYGYCDGSLEVTGVSPGYTGYDLVYVQCRKCRCERAYPNPRRRQAPAKQADETDWRHDRKRAASGERL